MFDMKGSSSLDMTTGPFYKKIIKFSVPLMLTSLLQILYNAADVMVVGKFASRQALAAVSSNGALVNLILNLFIGFSIGSGVVIACFIGAGNKRATSRAVHTAMTFAILLGFVALIIGEGFARGLLGIMGTPEDVIDLATLYLRVFFLGAPASLTFNFGSAILRANGDTKRPMIISALSGILNIILNLVFVIYFKMSVSGVALATIISQYMTAVWVVIILLKRDDASRLEFSKLKLHNEELAEIVRIGLPTGLSSTCFALSNVTVQSAINSFGSIAVAGNGAASNIDNVVYVCMDAFPQACTTFVAQNVGAKNYDNINKVFYHCMVLVAIVAITTGGISAIFAKSLLGLFTNDPEVIKFGAEKVRYVATCYFMCGWMNCAAGAIRSMGKPFTSMMVSLIGSCGLRIIWVFTIFRIFHTLPVLYSVYITSWIITFSVLYIFYLRIRKKMRITETV